jgi:DNA repair exonuclease SbcCD ATPase subunit
MLSEPEKWKEGLTRKRVAFETACQQLHEEKEALASLERQQKAIDDATLIAQKVAEEIQTQAHIRIAEIVSQALSAVFEEDSYEFRIIFERKRSKTEARMVFVRDGLEVDPLTAAGGGVVDVAAFALRVACLVLGQPQKRRVLILDEPLRHLSRDYRPRVRSFIEGLAKDLGIQVVCITHAQDLQAGKIYFLGERGEM